MTLERAVLNSNLMNGGYHDSLRYPEVQSIRRFVSTGLLAMELAVGTMTPPLHVSTEHGSPDSLERRRYGDGACFIL